jgi:putative membrane protein
VFKRLLIRLAMVAVILGIVAWLVPGIDVHGGVGTLLWLAVLFSLVNLIAGTLMRLLALPLIVVTLGLFLLVINAAVLAITAWLSSDLDVDNFAAAFFGALLIAIIGWFAELLLPLRSKSSRHA